jgi:hypothetical protein
MLPQLVADEGKYALIRGEELLGVFGTYEDALTDGYKTLGLDPFLVKKIEAVERVQFISRFFGCPCHT